MWPVAAMLASTVKPRGRQARRAALGGRALRCKVHAVLAWLLLAARLGLWLMLLAAAAHLGRLAAWAWSRPRASSTSAPPAPPELLAHPMVTVQLPMRNVNRDVDTTCSAFP